MRCLGLLAVKSLLVGLLARALGLWSPWPRSRQNNPFAGLQLDELVCRMCLTMSQYFRLGSRFSHDCAGGRIIILLVYQMNPILWEEIHLRLVVGNSFSSWLVTNPFNIIHPDRLHALPCAVGWVSNNPQDLARQQELATSEEETTSDDFFWNKAWFGNIKIVLNRLPFIFLSKVVADGKGCGNYHISRSIVNQSLHFVRFAGMRYIRRIEHLSIYLSIYLY